LSCADLLESFESKASDCADDPSLRDLLAEVARELGFDHVALLHHASLAGGSPDLIRLDTYPVGWEDDLAAQGLTGADPVHQACLRTSIGFAWAELPALAELGLRQRQVLERARRFDIGDGFSVPANIPGEPAGSCSFAVRVGRSLPRKLLLCAEQIGAHAFHAARRIHGYLARPRRPHLSRRERQCVRLVAAGKTDWEMAAILGLSVETVRQYVKRARAAYDVVSRAQLVACGLRDGVVRFEEAIPPDGGMG
jgi:LuxR family quorum-sensing system transcriptional regulator CciR